VTDKDYKNAVSCSPFRIVTSHVIHYNHHMTLLKLRNNTVNRHNNNRVAVVPIWPNSHFKNHQSTCGVWGFHNNVAEDSV